MADDTNTPGSTGNGLNGGARAPGASPGPAKPAGATAATKPTAATAKRPPGRPAKRSAPPATPGPKIIRPAASAPLEIDQAAFLKDTRPAPAAARPATRPPKTNAAKLQSAHARVAERLGMPELEISADEAADVQQAITDFGQLTGWTFSSDTVTWWSVFTTMAWVYGLRLMEISARKRRERAEAEAAKPAVASRGTPDATATQQHARPPAAAPAAPAPAPLPAKAPPRMPVPPPVNGAGAAPPSMDNLGTVELPAHLVKTSLAERLGPI